MNNIYVSKTGTIRTIQKALELVVKDAPTTIIIGEGIYYEKICVHNDNIIIRGNCKDNTYICYNDFSAKIHEDKMEYNTFRTYTMIITSNNVVLENITIKNCAGSSKVFSQAVALHLLGDKITIKNCAIDSCQDTIFSGPLPSDLQIRYAGFLPKNQLMTSSIARHYFYKCNIYGDIDFIFGGGNAVFLKCKIISVGESGYIAAPSTNKISDYGLTFITCEFVNGGKAKNVFLARPWRDYGACAFINCKYDTHINKVFFNKWNNTQRDKTCRFRFYNIPLVYKKSIVPWAKELITLEQYSINKIFNDWIPSK